MFSLSLGLNGTPAPRVRDPTKRFSSRLQLRKGEAVNHLETVRLNFICPHCTSVNELTAAHLYEAAMIHCSHCSTAIASLGVLRHRLDHQSPEDLRQAG